MRAELFARDLDANPATVEAYYDNVLDITWTADANLPRTQQFGVVGIDVVGEMSWTVAQQWIAAMNAASYLGHNAWRLPAIAPANGSSFDLSFSNDGSTDAGTGDHKPSSELAYHFHINQEFAGHEIYIRNPAAPSEQVSNPDYSGHVRKITPFDNLTTGGWDYWYGTEFDATKAFLTFQNVDQGATDKTNAGVKAWAVHDGDIGAVITPTTVDLEIAKAHVLKFGTVSGRTYTLETTETLNGLWTDTGETLTGDGSDQSFCVEASKPKEFYRVVESN